LGILVNPAGNSEGFDKKVENPNGRGELKYGSRPWYGMDIFWNCPLF